MEILSCSCGLVPFFTFLLFCLAGSKEKASTVARSPTPVLTEVARVLAELGKNPHERNDRLMCLAKAADVVESGANSEATSVPRSPPDSDGK